MGMDISEGPLHRRLVFSFVWGGPLQFAPANCSPRSWPEKTQRRGETLRVGTRDRHPRKPQTLYTHLWPFLHTLHTCSRGGMAKKRWASCSLQTQNCATGREQILSETAGALLLLMAPAWKRRLPTNLEIMKWWTGPGTRAGGIGSKQQQRGRQRGQYACRKALDPCCYQTHAPEPEISEISDWGMGLLGA